MKIYKETLIFSDETSRTYQKQFLWFKWTKTYKLEPSFSKTDYILKKASDQTFEVHKVVSHFSCEDRYQSYGQMLMKSEKTNEEDQLLYTGDILACKAYIDLYPKMR